MNRNSFQERISAKVKARWDFKLLKKLKLNTFSFLKKKQTVNFNKSEFVFKIGNIYLIRWQSLLNEKKNCKISNSWMLWQKNSWRLKYFKIIVFLTLLTNIWQQIFDMQETQESLQDMFFSSQFFFIVNSVMLKDLFKNMLLSCMCVHIVKIKM